MNFIQMPKIIFNPKSKYFKLSNNAKIMYGLMIDRYSLSIANFKKGDKTFFDKNNNRCFIVFSTNELIKYTGLSSRTTVIKTKQELIDLGLIKGLGSNKSSKFFVFQPIDDVGENICKDNKKSYNEKKVEFKVTKENKIDIPKTQIMAKDVILGNFNKDNTVLDSSISNNDDYYLIQKWKIKEDCDICNRLLNLLKNNKNTNEITDKEFWYLRNNIQRYEINNSIGNFGAFVKSLRRQYKEQKDFLKINPGEKTQEDINNEINSSIATKKEYNLDDENINDILNFNYLKDMSV